MIGYVCIWGHAWFDLVCESGYNIRKGADDLWSKMVSYVGTTYHPIRTTSGTLTTCNKDIYADSGLGVFCRNLSE